MRKITWQEAQIQRFESRWGVELSVDSTVQKVIAHNCTQLNVEWNNATIRLAFNQYLYISTPYRRNVFENNARWENWEYIKSIKAYW